MIPNILNNVTNEATADHDVREGKLLRKNANEIQLDFGEVK